MEKMERRKKALKQCHIGTYKRMSLDVVVFPRTRKIRFKIPEETRKTKTGRSAAVTVEWTFSPWSLDLVQPEDSG